MEEEDVDSPEEESPEKEDEYLPTGCNWLQGWCAMVFLSAAAVTMLLVIPERWLLQLLILAAGILALVEGWTLWIFPQECLESWRAAMLFPKLTGPSHLYQDSRRETGQRHRDVPTTRDAVSEEDSLDGERQRLMRVRALGENPAYLKQVATEACSTLTSSQQTLQKLDAASAKTSSE